jgi:integrase/recombinase XerD
VTTDALLAEFRAYQARRGVRDSTQKTYGQYLRPFLKWVGPRDVGALGLRELEVEWLGMWGDAVEERIGRRPSPRTLRNHIIALRVFFAFLHTHEFIARNPAALLVAPRPIRRRNDWLTPEEDAALFQAAIRPTEQIVIALLRWTGMRSAEAESLLVRDVDVSGGMITIRSSKTQAGVRAVPIFPPLVPFLSSWHEHQQHRGVSGSHHPLLATRTGLHMSHAQLWVTVKRVAGRGLVRPQVPRDLDRHNISAVSPHTLRRTFATDLLNRGVRIEVVSKLLGHSNTRTTEDSYAELLDRTIVAESFAAFPLR